MEASLQRVVQGVLADALLAAGGAGELVAGRTERLDQNMIRCMTVEQLRRAADDLAQGDGEELVPDHTGRPPLHSAHSSAALVVNSYACFLGREHELSLAGRSGFDTLRFEAKFPIFRGGRAPNLDLAASSPGQLVAVESKCTEYLKPPRIEFRPAYDRPEATGLTDGGWEGELDALKAAQAADLARYRWLDAAQLVKHYLGLRKRRRDEQFTLLYVYWEPSDAAGVAPFDEHRAEIDAFAERVSGGSCEFVSSSYRDLWESWSREGPGWLQEHVTALLARYDVPVRDALTAAAGSAASPAPGHS